MLKFSLLKFYLIFFWILVSMFFYFKCFHFKVSKEVLSVPVLFHLIALSCDFPGVWWSFLPLAFRRPQHDPSMWKFLGQGWHLSQSRNPTCSSDNAGSLTHCATSEVPSVLSDDAHPDPFVYLSPLVLPNYPGPHLKELFFRSSCCGAGK